MGEEAKPLAVPGGEHFLNAIGWCFYWSARVASFVRVNLWRGWNQIYKCDYDGPHRWEDF